MEHLECDRALVPEIPGQEHRGHAAPAQLALQEVAIAQAALEPLPKLFHPSL